MRKNADHPLLQLTLMRMREFIREPEAVFWSMIFPIALAAGLGIAFRSRPPEVLKVAAVTPKMNFRRVRTLLTLTSGYHVDDLVRMARDQHEMDGDEQPQEAETPQMHHAGAIIAAEQNRQKMQLDWFVDGESGQHHHDSEDDHAGVCETLQTIIEIRRRRRLAKARIVGKLA